MSLPILPVRNSLPRSKFLSQVGNRYIRRQETDTASGEAVVRGLSTTSAETGPEKPLRNRRDAFRGPPEIRSMEKEPNQERFIGRTLVVKTQKAVSCQLRSVVSCVNDSSPETMASALVRD